MRFDDGLPNTEIGVLAGQLSGYGHISIYVVHEAEDAQAPLSPGVVHFTLRKNARKNRLLIEINRSVEPEWGGMEWGNAPRGTAENASVEAYARRNPFGGVATAEEWRIERDGSHFLAVLRLWVFLPPFARIARR